jgi:acylphosphatase
MAQARKRVLVSGRVQGVCFRAYAEDRANELGVLGWVRNRADGRVEAVVEGDEAAVAEMLRWFHKGSPAARVTGVEVEDEEPTGEFDGFGVRR